MTEGKQNIKVDGNVDNSTFITGDIILPLPSPTPLFQLRAPVGDFVGREKEIETLTAALRNGGSASVSGINGMGGIGKTELALLVANRLREDYPDAQLFVDMRGVDPAPRDPADALASCIRAFVGAETKLPDSLEDLVKLYLSSLNNKRALVVLDNAFDGAQIKPLLPPPGSALLVTSRNSLVSPGIKRVRLDQLEPFEARELLMSIAPRVESEIADQICFRCGFLPLAIRAVGSLLAVSEDVDPAAYATELKDEHTRLERIGTEGVDTGVESSFKLSYDRLEPEVQRVCCSLAVFPASFDSAAVEFICEDHGHKHLTNLTRRSVVIYNDKTKRYRLHDLARLFAIGRSKVTQFLATQKLHATHYKNVLRITKKYYEQGGEAILSALNLFDLEWENIRTGQAWATGQVEIDDDAAGLCIDYAAVGTHLLELRQHPRDRIRWLNTAVSAARRLNRRSDEGVAFSNLGNAYFNLGDTGRAIDYYEKRLPFAREIGDRRAEGITLGNLGLAYFTLGQIQRSIEFYEHHLIISREIGERRSEGHALGSLGLSYATLGDFQRAIEFHHQHLTISREIGDRRGEGHALGNLGLVYSMMGETGNAIQFSEQALTIDREIGDRRGEGRHLWNMSLIFAELGDLRQCIPYAEEAFGIYEQIEDPHASEVRDKLAEWRGEQ